MTGDDIVAEARKWVGVPWIHQGRSIHGIDCLGLLVMVAREFGIPHDDRTDYSRIPDGHVLEAALDRHFIHVPDRRAGDVLMFKMTKYPRHVGIYTGVGTMVHVSNDAHVMRCIESTLDRYWLTQLKKTYRFREVAVCE